MRTALILAWLGLTLLLGGCMMPDQKATVAANEIKLAKEGIIRPDIGATAPEFSTQDAAGQAFSLAGALESGKFVLLFFYPANNTPNSARNLKALQKAAPALLAEGVQVFAVNPGSQEEGVDFFSQAGISLTLLDDPGLATAMAYGCAKPGVGFPQRTLVGVNPEGEIVMFYRGFFPGADPTQAILKELGLDAKSVKPATDSAADPDAEQGPAQAAPAPAPTDTTSGKEPAGE